MNVAFDPWIPVVTLDGQPKLASLCEVLTAGHLLADLSVRPHERVSLMRLFLCVAHAALEGPKDYDEWQKVPARLPGSAKKYLDKWKDSFELFHPTKPWLQIAGLKSVKGADEGWGPVSKLAFFRATGANTTLFDHEGLANDDRSIPLSDTVLSLLTFQCFSPGGLISQVVWSGTLTTKSSKDGPCVSASMVHGLVRRENVARTVQANLPTHEDVSLVYGDRALGRPVWEQMPSSLKDESAKKNATESYVGRLVPLTRVVRLHKDGKRMLMGDGLACPPFADGFPAEPTAVVVVRIKQDKPERGLLSYRPGKALWRELGAMIVKRNAEGVGGPLSLRSLGETDTCDLLVCALARDQATILDTSESVYGISPRLRMLEGRAIYEAEAHEAEEIGRRLDWAIDDYRRALDGGWDGRLKGAGPRKGELLAKLRENASTQFWTSVEASLSLLFVHVDALASDQAVATRDAWRAMLSQAAREAYWAVCGQETPRQIKAFTEGWRKLLLRPKRTETTLERKGAQQ